MPMKMPGWVKPIAIAEPEPPAPSHIRCGVPDCADGREVSNDGVTAVVECDTHEARTTHDAVLKPKGEQQVIRVQDQWRQHGTQPPPGRR